MFASYGAPVVLETVAGGVNVGLQLADGTQVQFASTARAATFLYSLAVQRMQATSFVTNNYNLDMQWLNSADQPLLEQSFSNGQDMARVLSLAQAVADNIGTWSTRAVERNGAMANLIR